MVIKIKNIVYGLRPLFSLLIHGRGPNTHSYQEKHIVVLILVVRGLSYGN